MASILVTVTAAYVAYRTVLFTVAAAEMAVATAAAFASGNLVKGALAVGGAAATVLVFSKTLSSLQEMMTGVTTATSSQSAHFDFESGLVHFAHLSAVVSLSETGPLLTCLAPKRLQIHEGSWKKCEEAKHFASPEGC